MNNESLLFSLVIDDFAIQQSVKCEQVYQFAAEGDPKDEFFVTVE